MFALSAITCHFTCAHTGGRERKRGAQRAEGDFCSERELGDSTLSGERRGTGASWEEPEEEGRLPGTLCAHCN